MTTKDSSIVFDQERASSYDKHVAKLAPMRDALDFLMRMLLSELPGDARVLCIGVGTGSELIYLSHAFPRWQFTVVEPAAPMLDICRQRAEEQGITARCRFHEGYLDSLTGPGGFDAATSLLVSQFFMQAEQRRGYFSQIASRLRPGGYLVNADLAGDTSTSNYTRLLALWARTLSYADMPAEELEKRISSCGVDLSVLAPQEIESIIASGGFDAPVLFFQAVLMHAWYARRLP